MGVRGRREWEGAPRCCAKQANYASPHKQVWACKSCLHTARVRARPRVRPWMAPAQGLQLWHQTRDAWSSLRTEMMGQGKAARGGGGEGPGRQREPSGDAQSRMLQLLWSRLGGALTSGPHADTTWGSGTRRSPGCAAPGPSSLSLPSGSVKHRSQQKCRVLRESLGTTSSHLRSRMAAGEPASPGPIR